MGEGRKPKKVSYLKEMLLHPASTYGGLGALAAGALLSIPFGLGVGALPLLAYAATEGIASLFVPTSPGFRAKVDEKQRSKIREQSRAHLIEEIERRVHLDSARNWQVYLRMRERLQSLLEVARSRSTPISEQDLERLDDASVKYLGLWFAKLVIAERRSAADDTELRARLKSVTGQLQSAKSREQRRHLEKARDDLGRTIQRRDSLRSRETSLDATMLSMADSFEEVYQRIVTNPASGDVAKHLHEAVDRMRLEEDLDLALEEEIDDLFQTRRTAQAGAERLKAT